MGPGPTCQVKWKRPRRFTLSRGEGVFVGSARAAQPSAQRSGPFGPTAAQSREGAARAVFFSSAVCFLFLVSGR